MSGQLHRADAGGPLFLVQVLLDLVGSGDERPERGRAGRETTGDAPRAGALSAGT